MDKKDNVKPKVYAVANAHLDTVWNWTLEDTVKRHLVRTLKENFELFSKYPEYKFNFEGAYRYELIKEFYPEDYEKLKEYIAEGKWFVTGSAWENGDVIMSSPEALIRNILYGNRYFRDEFGKMSNDIFLPDCFGFAYTLPTIMKHMGLTAFSSAKLIWNSGNKVPFEVGVWKGIDGSEVVASIAPGQYVTQVHEKWSTDESMYDLVSNLPVKKTLKYYGVGDEGGAPTEGSVKNICASVNDRDGKVEVVSAYAGQIVDEMTPEERAALPVYDGELLMTTHGVGAYTSVAPLKRWNRQNEQAADFAERTNVLASHLGLLDYPKEILEDAWKMVIRHQFHDDLPGTSLQKVYTETYTDYITSLNKFVHELAAATENISDNIDTSKLNDGIPVVVYNGVTADREDLVTCNVDFEGEAPEYIKVFTNAGEEVPSQIISRDGSKLEIAFIAKVESDGYNTYKVIPSSEPCTLNTGLKVTENVLENNNYKVEIDSNGDIASVYDKVNNKELLKSPIRYEILENSYCHWGAWEILYEDVQREPRSIVGTTCKPVVRIVENGPARVSVEITRMDGVSTFKQVVSLTANSNFVNVDNNVNWVEHFSMLKVAFPLAISNEIATYDAGLGAIDRGNNEQMKYEVPVHQWANLTDSDSNYSVTIMNDSKYGMDKPADDIMRLTAIHTPQNKFLDGTRQDLQDFGENRFSYAIMGGEGDWRESSSRVHAARYNQPLVAVQTTAHEGSLPVEYSFVKVNDEQVMVKAIKPAEDTDEIIVRVHETFGMDATGIELEMADGIVAAREVNGFEDHIADATVKDGKLVFDINRFAIKTFAIKLKDSKFSTKKKEYKTIELDCNTTISSTNDKRGEYGFGENKVTVPAEILPGKLVVGGVPFEFNMESDVHKGVLADGQKITLPENTKKLYFVATSLNDDKEFNFDVNGSNVNIKVQALDSYVGGWDQYGSNHYGYIKEDTLAYSASHTHDVSGDNVYGKFCLFKYEIDIAEGVDSVTLPKDKDLLVVAVTALVNGKHDSKLVTRKIDKKEKRITRTLTVVDGTGSGEYKEGNPICITYSGDKVGDVKWVSDTGEEFYGYTFEMSMADKDMTLTPIVTEFGKNIADACETFAIGEIDKFEASNITDGRKDTCWKVISLKESWVILDLGSEKSFDTVLIKHAGFGGEDNVLNTSSFEIQIFNNDEWVTIADVIGNRLSVTTHKFDTVKSRYIRLLIKKPTRNQIDKCTRIYGIEVYNINKVELPDTDKSDMTPFDLIDDVDEYEVIYKGNVTPGEIIELDDKYLIKKWYVSNMSSATLFAGEDKDSLDAIDTATKKKFDNIQRIVKGSDASFVKVDGELIDSADDCELTIIGKSLSIVLKKRWLAKEAGTRNNYAEIKEDGSVFLPKDDTTGGHDIFGLEIDMTAGPIRLEMTVKITDEELGTVSDDVELFAFNPIFPGGDVIGNPITIADYKNAEENDKGYKILFADFILAGNGGIEGRISSTRSVDMTVADFAVYEI